MVQLVERKVRSRAKQLYESRGQEAGQDLQDWFQAESEVLGKSIVAPLYRRLRSSAQGTGEAEGSPEIATESASSSETGADLNQH